MKHVKGDTYLDRIKHFQSKERARKLNESEKEDIVIRVTETLAKEKAYINRIGTDEGSYIGTEGKCETDGDWIQDEINEIDSPASDLTEVPDVPKRGRGRPKGTSMSLKMAKESAEKYRAFKSRQAAKGLSIDGEEAKSLSMDEVAAEDTSMGGVEAESSLIDEGEDEGPYRRESAAISNKKSSKKTAKKSSREIKTPAISVEKLPDAESRVIAKLGENFRYRGYQESEFTVSETFIINNLKILAAEARADKKYKESKDCIELLARIIGIVGEKVRKESSVITRNVSEVSSDLMLATKALGIELPPGVMSLIDARKNGK